MATCTGRTQQGMHQTGQRHCQKPKKPESNCAACLDARAPLDQVGGIGCLQLVLKDAWVLEHQVRDGVSCRTKLKERGVHGSKSDMNAWTMSVWIAAAFVG